MMPLLQKDLTNQNLFIFSAADIVPSVGRKTSPCIIVMHIIFSGPLGSFVNQVFHRNMKMMNVGGRAVGRASTIGFRSITPKPFQIFE